MAIRGFWLMLKVFWLPPKKTIESKAAVILINSNVKSIHLYLYITTSSKCKRLVVSGDLFQNFYGKKAQILFENFWGIFSNDLFRRFILFLISKNFTTSKISSFGFSNKSSIFGSSILAQNCDTCLRWCTSSCNLVTTSWSLNLHIERRQNPAIRIKAKEFFHEIETFCGINFLFFLQKIVTSSLLSDLFIICYNFVVCFIHLYLKHHEKFFIDLSIAGE